MMNLLRFFFPFFSFSGVSFSENKVVWLNSTHKASVLTDGLLTDYEYFSGAQTSTVRMNLGFEYQISRVVVVVKKYTDGLFIISHFLVNFFFSYF